MNKRINKVKYGSIGEDIASDFLVKNGYEIIDRNVRLGRFGEIDIIASQGEYICFIEVKTRNSILFGMPSEAVDARKQEKLRMLAGMYLDRRNMRNSSVRFDIIEVITRNQYGKITAQSINIIKNAF